MDPDDFDIGNEPVEKVAPKKRKVSDEDNLLKLACQKLARSGNGISALAKGWASQYEELTNDQQVCSRTIFADVLFHGCLGKLSEKTVEDIHKVLQGTSVVANIENYSRTSTPCSAEYNVQSGQSCSSSCHHLNESVFSPSQELTQIYVSPVAHNSAINRNQTFFTQHQVFPTERMEPTQTISQFLQDFVDE